MPLNDTFIRNLKPVDKAKKYADGQGLFLFLTKKGTKSWRFRYRDINSEEREMTLGTYPELSLSDARARRLEQRKLVQNGIDPIREKLKQAVSAKIELENTFEAVAREWHERNKTKWTEGHAARIWGRLENHVLPVVRNMNIADITANVILQGVIRPVENDGKTETSHRILQYCSSIFRVAVVTDRASHNPLSDLRGVLKPHKTVNRPSIDITELPEFINTLEASKCDLIYKLALKLLMLTFVRPAELRKTKWEYFDIKNRIWKIPAADMKMRLEHWVPLSRQALDVLEQLRKISGDNQYLFPTKNMMKYPYMNVNALNRELHKMGYKDRLCSHGFRSLASTTLNEIGYNDKVVDRQLAHVPKDKVEAAYNRAKYIKQRTELMQGWADHIDKVCLEAAEDKSIKIAALRLPQNPVDW